MIQRSGGVEGLVLAEQPRRWPSSLSDGVEVYSLSPLCVKRTQVDEAAAFLAGKTRFAKRPEKARKARKSPTLASSVRASSTRSRGIALPTLLGAPPPKKSELTIVIPAYNV